MAFGILESSLEHVPGTAILHEQSDVPREYQDVPLEQLKKGKGRLSHVVLVPQPSDDPNDPLNVSHTTTSSHHLTLEKWPQWKKELILFIVGLLAAVVGAFGPMLSPGFVEISAELGVSLNTLSQATAWLILTTGICLFIGNPIAKLYGKRPIYIFSIVILFVSSIWGGAATDYNSLLGSRILSGVGMAPFEVLMQITIGDLYFVHERATRLAIWNLFLLTGIAGGSFISGYVIQNLGYRWTFWLCSILFGICMIGVVLFVPETSFRRGQVQAPAYERKESSSDEKQSPEHAQEGELGGTGPEVPQYRMSYLSSLRIYTGRYTKAPLWKIFVRPFVVFWYPAVLWAFLAYGTTLSWIIVFSVVNASIFTAPPYNFTISETGLISLSPFVLTIVGALVSGPLNDWICLKLTERNRGIYEPEFRLVLIIPATFLGICGFFGFGKLHG